MWSTAKNREKSIFIPTLFIYEKLGHIHQYHLKCHIFLNTRVLYRLSVLQSGSHWSQYDYLSTGISLRFCKYGTCSTLAILVGNVWEGRNRKKFVYMLATHACVAEGIGLFVFCPVLWYLYWENIRKSVGVVISMKILCTFHSKIVGPARSRSLLLTNTLRYFVSRLVQGVTPTGW